MTRFLAILIRAVLWTLLKSCRIEVIGLDRIKKRAKEGPLIIGLWHDELVPLAEVLLSLTPECKFVAFVSKSRDGKLLSEFVRRYPSAAVVEVPHNGRGVALKEMIHHLSDLKEIGLMTPDGPRGPRHKVKEGIRMAARESGAVIIPFYWRSDSVIELSTWDRMKFPKPFTPIRAFFGPELAPDDPKLEIFLTGSEEAPFDK